VTSNGQWDYERRARDRVTAFRLFWATLMASKTLRRIFLILGVIAVGSMYYDVGNIIWAVIFFVIWIITSVGATLRRRSTSR
jgi:hypothetical protein